MIATDSPQWKNREKSGERGNLSGSLSQQLSTARIGSVLSNFIDASSRRRASCRFSTNITNE